MRFLIDAQFPYSLSSLLSEQGHDCLHTLDLKGKNKTSDSEICTLAQNEGRIVITKDQDFFDSNLLTGIPEKLLLVRTGNTSNKALFNIIHANLNRITESFIKYSVVVLTREEVIIYH
ncbi:MAG: DUF5615 family PIN-like protein [bacterium]